MKDSGFPRGEKKKKNDNFQLLCCFIIKAVSFA